MDGFKNRSEQHDYTDPGNIRQTYLSQQQYSVKTASNIVGKTRQITSTAGCLFVPANQNYEYGFEAFRTIPKLGQKMSRGVKSIFF